MIEEGCAAEEAICALASPTVRPLVVPRGYSTPAGTRYKARAEQYATALRGIEGEARADVWVLHMDDDTSIGSDTAREIARFIGDHGDKADLAQGVLTYPRHLAKSRWAWLADAVRPGDDLTRFRALTGSGHPLGGLHGELLLVRSSVEDDIGWDFGPDAITEDSQFALHFAHRYPGRSRWFPGRSYGASPVSIADLVRQRRRWAQGLLGVVLDSRVPRRHRALLGYTVACWLLGPLQHVAVVLAVAFLLGMPHTSPVVRPLVAVWAVNLAYVVFMYLEGLRANARASGLAHPRPCWAVAGIALIPLWSFVEATGAALGVVRFLRRTGGFEVIAKPA